MAIEFKESNNLSIGVELELQLINPANYNLSQEASELLRRLALIKFPGEIKPEITQSMVELNTSIHVEHGKMLQELIEVTEILNAQARQMNIAICGGGTHPFQKWSDRRIFPKERFESLSILYGYLAKQFTVFGQHIHIGCESGNAAIFLCHAFSRYIPHFIALSASSPFSQEVDTAFNSSRLNVISSFPTSGNFPLLENWASFVNYYERLVNLGVIKSIKDLYWDIRPKPEYGTVEIRICDTPLSIERAADLAAYAQTLALYFMKNQKHLSNDYADGYLVYAYNKFQASRHGLTGAFIDTNTQKTAKIQDDICSTIDFLKEEALFLNNMGPLQRLKEIAQAGKNDAINMRSVFEKEKSLQDIVKFQIYNWQGISNSKQF